MRRRPLNPRNPDRPVFDASALLALLQDEPGSEKLLPLQDHAVVSAVNVAEIIAKLVARGMPIREAQQAFEALHLEVVPFVAIDAAMSARYVQKGVSLGDRCFLATALSQGRGWTSDRGLEKLFRRASPQLKFFR